jgi:RNA polymerase sigma factor (sigma-70 family)
MASAAASVSRKGRPFVAVAVLGAALSTFAPGQVRATQAPPAHQQAISDLGRYCTACWKNARLSQAAWPDCTQEVFKRLLERVPTDAWCRCLSDDGDERREFVRAIDAVKKRTQRARRAVAGLDGLADVRERDARDLADDRELVRQAAADLLSPRQQRILQLGMEGWSVHETAEELGLSPERVSDEKYKAIRKLRAHLVQQVN